MTEPIANLEELTRRLEALTRRYGRVHGVAQDGDWLMLKLTEEVGELARAWLAVHGRTRHANGVDAETLRRALRHEMADVICFLIVMAGRSGIDLNAAITEKWMQFEPEIQRDIEAGLIDEPA